MTKWDRIPAATQLAICAEYGPKCGVKPLGRKFGFGLHVIRSVLAANGVAIQPSTRAGCVRLCNDEIAERAAAVRAARPVGSTTAGH